MSTPLAGLVFKWQGNPWYLVGSLYFIAVWGFIYWRAKNSRKLILSSSVLLMLVCFLLESLYIVDYWRPEHLAVLRWEWNLKGRA
jgi:ABC-type transport system involved in multi-copper enzyme maturation permease subunit